MFRVVALASLLAVACTDSSEPGPDATSRVERKELVFGFAPELDLLVVVDTSPASASYRAMLVQQAAEIAGALTTADGTPALHIGVVESGCSGDDGRLRTDPTIDGPFLSDAPAADGSRVRNYQGTLADALGRLLDVTASDCASTRPFEAAQHALDNTVDNAGFWRPTANLAVVFVSARDDGTMTSVETLAEELEARKSDPAKIWVAGVIAPASSTCDAEPAPRMRAFLDRFPSRHVEASICDTHYADAFSWFAYGKPLGVACWDAQLADLDPATPGLQPDCTAQYRFADQTEGVLPECTDDNGLCWRNVSAEAACSATGLSPRVDTRGTMYPYESTVTIECVVAD